MRITQLILLLICETYSTAREFDNGRANLNAACPQAAVTGEGRAALKDAASVVGTAAKEVTSPERETLTASHAAINKVRASFAQARQRFRQQHLRRV